jgi:hypothetical protein
MRKLSELIGTDHVGGSVDVEVDCPNIIDPYHDRSKMRFKVGNNNDTLDSHQKVGETQSRAIKNMVNHTRVHNVDGGSSLRTR